MADRKARRPEGISLFHLCAVLTRSREVKSDRPVPMTAKAVVAPLGTGLDEVVVILRVSNCLSNYLRGAHAAPEVCAVNVFLCKFRNSIFGERKSEYRNSFRVILGLL